MRRRSPDAHDCPGGHHCVLDHHRVIAGPHPGSHHAGRARTTARRRPGAPAVGPRPGHLLGLRHHCRTCRSSCSARGGAQPGPGMAHLSRQLTPSPWGSRTSSSPSLHPHEACSQVEETGARAHPRHQMHALWPLPAAPPRAPAAIHYVRARREHGSIRLLQPRRRPPGHQKTSLRSQKLQGEPIS